MKDLPVLDIRALWSVGLEQKKRISYSFWPDYVQFCWDIANRNGIKMRTLDRALWRFSFDHRKQGTLVDFSSERQTVENATPLRP